MQLVILHPVVDLGLGHTNDILGGIGGGLTTANIQEIQTGGSLEQDLLVASGIAEVTNGVLLDQGSGLGVVLLLADDLLHGIEPPFQNFDACVLLYIFWSGNQVQYGEKTNNFTNFGRMIDFITNHS